MTFPLRYEVDWYAFNPSVNTDELGNEVESWLPPVKRKVIGWVPDTNVKFGEFEQREVVDVLLLVPPGFTYNKRDRVDLEGDATELYWCVGGNDYSNTSPFTAWKPGSTIRLRVVKG